MSNVSGYTLAGSQMRELSDMEVAQVSGGAIPAAVYVGVKWAGGAVAAGFFGKAGANLYD